MKMPDAEAYKLAEKYSIKTAGWFTSLDETSAFKKASKMGFPLYLKIDSPDIIHKSRQGCVKLAYKDNFLSSFREVKRNAKKITNNINGIIVQKPVNGNETIIGIKIDAQFGYVIMFGSGGILTELIKDVSFRLIPLSKKDATEMILDTKIASLLSKNTNQIVSVLSKVSKLAVAYNIRELDINPLIVSEKGPIAADIRIIQ